MRFAPFLGLFFSVFVVLFVPRARADQPAPAGKQLVGIQGFSPREQAQLEEGVARCCGNPAHTTRLNSHFQCSHPGSEAQACVIRLREDAKHKTLTGYVETRQKLQENADDFRYFQSQEIRTRCAGLDYGRCAAQEFPKLKEAQAWAHAEATVGILEAACIKSSQRQDAQFCSTPVAYATGGSASATPSATPPKNCVPRRALSGELSESLGSCLTECVDPIGVPTPEQRCKSMNGLNLKEMVDPQIMQVLALQDGETLVTVARLKSLEKLVTAYRLQTGQVLKESEMPKSCGSEAASRLQKIQAARSSSEPPIFAQRLEELTQNAAIARALDLYGKKVCDQARESTDCAEVPGLHQSNCSERGDLKVQCSEVQKELHEFIVSHPTLAVEGLAKRLVDAAQKQSATEGLEVLQQEEKKKITLALDELCSADWKSLLRHPIGNAAAQEVVDSGLVGAWAKNCLDSRKNFPQEVWKDLPNACMAASGAAFIAPQAGFVLGATCFAGSLLGLGKELQENREHQRMQWNCQSVDSSACHPERLRQLENEAAALVANVYLTVGLEAAAPALTAGAVELVKKALTLTFAFKRKLTPRLAREAIEDLEMALGEVKFNRSGPGGSGVALQALQRDREQALKIPDVQSNWKKLVDKLGSSDKPLKQNGEDIALEWVAVQKGLPFRSESGRELDQVLEKVPDLSISSLRQFRESRSLKPLVNFEGGNASVKLSMEDIQALRTAERRYTFMLNRATNAGEDDLRKFAANRLIAIQSTVLQARGIAHEVILSQNPVIGLYLQIRLLGQQPSKPQWGKFLTSINKKLDHTVGFAPELVGAAGGVRVNKAYFQGFRPMDAIYLGLDQAFSDLSYSKNEVLAHEVVHASRNIVAENTPSAQIYGARFRLNDELGIYSKGFSFDELRAYLAGNEKNFPGMKKGIAASFLDYESSLRTGTQLAKNAEGQSLRLQQLFQNSTDTELKESMVVSGVQLVVKYPSEKSAQFNHLTFSQSQSATFFRLKRQFRDQPEQQIQEMRKWLKAQADQMQGIAVDHQVHSRFLMDLMNQRGVKNDPDMIEAIRRVHLSRWAKEKNSGSGLSGTDLRAYYEQVYEEELSRQILKNNQ